MAKKPTISEIKRMTERKSPYYFDRKTLKFFGQRMSDFKVHKTERGTIYIYAKMYREDFRTGKKIFSGYSIRRLDNKGMNSDLVATKYKKPSELPK